MKNIITLFLLFGLHFDVLAAAATPIFHSSAPVDLRPDPDVVPANQLLRFAKPKELFLRSSVALVLDEKDNVILYGRKIDERRPIASLTKLMTAMVTLDANLPLDEIIQIKRADRDRLRGSKSRLSFGTKLTRYDMLYIALSASENRAAYALARSYPGGKKVFMTAMNRKAKQLGMNKTYFKGPTGLHSKNVSTASDLAKLVNAAKDYELIHTMTTQAKGKVTDLRSGWEIEFLNTNRLVRKNNWHIGLSKTGYIADAGNCLVMQTEIANRPVIIVLLNSWGKLSKYGDSNRIKKWLIKTENKMKKAQGPKATSKQALSRSHQPSLGATPTTDIRVALE